MQGFFNKFRSLSVVVGLIATLAIATSRVAFASDPGTTSSIHATLNVTGGSAGVTRTSSATPDYGTANLTTPTANGSNLSVADLTDVNAGWSVTLAATTFTGMANAAHVLPITALTVTSVNQFLVNGGQTTNGNPINSVYTAMPIQVTGGGTTAELYNADGNSGISSTALVTNLALVLPISTFADTYTSTITVVIGQHLTA